MAFIEWEHVFPIRHMLTESHLQHIRKQVHYTNTVTTDPVVYCNRCVIGAHTDECTEWKDGLQDNVVAEEDLFAKDDADPIEPSDEEVCRVPPVLRGESRLDGGGTSTFLRHRDSRTCMNHQRECDPSSWRRIWPSMRNMQRRARNAP